MAARAPGLSTASEQHLRSARTIVVALAIVWGGLFGLLAARYDPAFGTVPLLASGGLLFVVLMLWGRVRRRARWVGALSGAVVVYLQVCFMFVSLAAVASTAGRLVATAVGVAVCVLIAWRVRRAIPAYDAEWETHRAVNEHEILDLGAGTYDVSRRFVPLRGRPGHSPAPADSASVADRAASLSPLIGAAAAVGSVLAGHGSGDTRALVLGALGATAAVAFAPVLAQAVVHLRRLCGYERQLGRPILNR